MKTLLTSEVQSDSRIKFHSCLIACIEDFAKDSCDQVYRDGFVRAPGPLVGSLRHVTPFQLSRLRPVCIMIEVARQQCGSSMLRL